MASTLKCKHCIAYFKENNKSCDLLIRKWEVLKELVRILKLPYLTTNYLQRENATLSDFFGIMIGLEIGLKKEINKTERKTNFAQLLQSTVSSRKRRLLSNRLMITAIYLDPRYKCELVNQPEKVVIAKITIEKIWHRIQSLKGNSHEINEINISNDGDKSIEEINLNSIFSDIDRHYDVENVSVETEGTVNTNVGIMQALDKYDTSLGTSRANSNQSVLQFWEENKNAYSTELCQVANTIHSTQSSIERLFSALNFIYSDRRYNLSQGLLENILILHSNVDLFNDVKKDELNELIQSLSLKPF